MLMRNQLRGRCVASILVEIPKVAAGCRTIVKARRGSYGEMDVLEQMLPAASISQCQDAHRVADEVDG